MFSTTAILLIGGWLVTGLFTGLYAVHCRLQAKYFRERVAELEVERTEAAQMLETIRYWKTKYYSLFTELKDGSTEEGA